MLGIHRLSVLALFLVPGVAEAEQVPARKEPAELTKLRESYETKRGSVITTSRKQHVRQLADAEQKLIAAERLNDAVQVREHRVALELVAGRANASGPLVPAKPPELHALAKAHASELARQTESVRKVYVEALGKLQNRLVKDKRIIDAALVQKARREAMAENYRLVIWNTHNGAARDRGSRKMNVILLERGQEVWSGKDIAIAFDSSENTRVEVPLKIANLSRARIRVEITEWHDRGGGLSEIQLFREGDARNLAMDAKAKASDRWDGQYPASAVVDGKIKAVGQSGFWLLKDSTPGWVELEF